jgi:signal transduction histidine kinase
MVGAHDGVYRDRMTSAGAAEKRRTGMARLAAAWSTYLSPRSGQVTLNALVGGVVAAFIWVCLGLLLLFQIAALLSLFDDPTGGQWLTVVYVGGTALLPVLLLWVVRGLGVLQRVRLREVLREEILDPPMRRWPYVLRLLQPCARASTWRQFLYHLVSLPVGIGGAVVVGFCWAGFILAVPYVLVDHRGPLVLFLPAVVLFGAAPWVARGVTWLDVTAARALLGPTRAEALELRVQSLTRSRAEVVAATDAERRRIERDLHDGAQQRLVSLGMRLGMARANPEISGPAREAIEAAHDEVVLALTELRQFVRGLHPAVLNDRGLDAALSGIAARAPLPVALHVDVPVRCSPSIEAVAYFVVSEALTNVAKHAQAGTAEVSVKQRGKRLRVVVRDDGRGGAALESGVSSVDQPTQGVTAQPPAHAVGGLGSGLRGLAQRAAAVDGTLTVDSPPGGPTTITVELPCES